MSLASEHEVILSSNLGYDFAPSWVSNNLERKEQLFCYNTFGWDFYEVLKADKVVYPLYEKYDSDVTYSNTDYALWNGRIYQSLINSNLNKPINDPDSWALAPKFTTTLYNQLWNNYLLRLIAQECSKDAAVFATFKSTKGGIVKFSDINTGAQAGSRTDVDTWLRAVRGNIEDDTRLMIRWIEEEVEKTTYAQEFDEIVWVKNNIDGACSPRSQGSIIGNRRIFFRHGRTR